MKKSVFDETGLKEYKRKRNFRVTAEPLPRPARGKAKKAETKEGMFVIQKHDATRLHYDFRLEMAGVLKSWAVPKGLPTSRNDRRLAVEVEDHPMDYARFEGTIPEGNYGAGTVMVWDIGTFTVSGNNPSQALEEGKLHLCLKGKKMKGEWTLVRMKPRAGDDKNNWLIFKSESDAKALSSRKDDESVLSKRSMKQIARENTAQWQSHRTSQTVDPRIAKAVSKRRRVESKAEPPSKKTSAKAESTTTKNKWEPILEKLPHGRIAYVEPMKCRLVEAPPAGAEWIYEIKFDGFRAIVLKEGNSVKLISRNKKSFNARFPEIVKAVQALPFEKGILDGEIVALDEQGRSSFQLLKTIDTPGEERAPLCFYAFDFLNFEGRNLRHLPLKERKDLLESLIQPDPEPVRVSASIHGEPDKLLAEIRKHGLEGIIAKDLRAEYQSGQRTGAWQKIKVINEQEFAIGGFSPPKGSRDYFGAILIGYFDKGQFIFASKVGTGFDHAQLKLLHQKLVKLRRANCPFDNLPQALSTNGRGLTRAEMKKCSWVEPRLVCQVSFTEWTRDGHLRHPVFLGLRDNKSPEEVVREEVK